MRVTYYVHCEKYIIDSNFDSIPWYAFIGGFQYVNESDIEEINKLYQRFDIDHIFIWFERLPIMLEKIKFNIRASLDTRDEVNRIENFTNKVLTSTSLRSENLPKNIRVYCQINFPHEPINILYDNIVEKLSLDLFNSGCITKPCYSVKTLSLKVRKSMSRSEYYCIENILNAFPNLHSLIIDTSILQFIPEEFNINHLFITNFHFDELKYLARNKNIKTVTIWYFATNCGEWTDEIDLGNITNIIFEHNDRNDTAMRLKNAVQRNSIVNLSYYKS
jgi:hypothetical protein